MSLSETPRTDLAIVTATTQGKKYVNASFCRTLERLLGETLSALKIIHTWSTFETKNNPKGHALVPDTVSKLCIKTLKRSSTATSGAISAKWSGCYMDMRGPNGTRVKWTGRCWIIRNRAGEIVSKHDSRTVALRKAHKLDANEKGQR
jgi:hypothetical protein